MTNTIRRKQCKHIYLNEIVVLTLCVTNYCIIVVGKLIKFEKRIFAYIALIL